MRIVLLQYENRIVMLTWRQLTTCVHLGNASCYPSSQLTISQMLHSHNMNLSKHAYCPIFCSAMCADVIQFAGKLT